MRILRHLRRERGIALPMALGIMFVLTISTTAAIHYTSTNSRTAGYSKGKLTAQTLSEAGLNNSMAVLNQPSNNPLKQSTMPACSGNPPPTPRRDDYAGGYVLWCGDLDLNELAWRVRSTGYVRNPNNATQIWRKVSAYVVVTPKPTQALTNPVWNYMVATDTGNVCDMTLNNGVVQNAPLYVMGNLCLAGGSNPSRITGGPLVVKGRLTLATTGNYVGTSAAPLTEAHIGVGCKYANLHAHPDTDGHPFCSSIDNVHATKLTQSPPAYALPAKDMAGWYENALPGPRQGCVATSGTPPVFDNNYPTRDASVTPVFNLTPTASYTCRVGPVENPAGELSWNAATKTLTVRGTVFIDGSAIVSNGAVNQYNGQAALYLSGTFLVAANTKLCGGIAGVDCDFAAWNPNTEMLTIVADGKGGQVPADTSVQIASGAQFQGAIHATGAIDLGANAKAEGPMVGGTIKLNSTTQTYPFGTIEIVPVGMPGNESVFAQPNPPQRFAG